jgi:hypothetical protein
MVVTDAMSAQFMAAAGVNTRNVLVPLANALSSVPSGAPGFAMFLAGLLVAGFALILWLELVVRAAGITAAALFLPIVLAALVWPAIGHWARRLADTLAALVLSKLVIAAVISLATGAIAGGLAGSGSASSKFGDVVVGIALLLLATLSPFMVLRLMPMVEAGSIGHLEAARHRLQQVAKKPVQLGTNMAMLLAQGQPSESGAAPAVGMPEMPTGGSAPNAEGKPWLGFGAETQNEERGLAPTGASMGSRGSADSHNTAGSHDTAGSNDEPSGDSHDERSGERIRRTRVLPPAPEDDPAGDESRGR